MGRPASPPAPAHHPADNLGPLPIPSSHARALGHSIRPLQCGTQAIATRLLQHTYLSIVAGWGLLVSHSHAPVSLTCGTILSSLSPPRRNKLRTITGGITWLLVDVLASSRVNNLAWVACILRRICGS
jgi:hypothetical protein